MTAPHPDERSVFLRAIDLADAGERAAFLDAACVGDRGLRAAVEALLRAHDQPQRLLDAEADHLSNQDRMSRLRLRP